MSVDHIRPIAATPPILNCTIALWKTSFHLRKLLGFTLRPSPSEGDNYFTRHGNTLVHRGIPLDEPGHSNYHLEDANEKHITPEDLSLNAMIVDKETRPVKSTERLSEETLKQCVGTGKTAFQEKTCEL
jgi:hypothetical protein